MREIMEFNREDYLTRQAQKVRAFNKKQQAECLRHLFNYNDLAKDYLKQAADDYEMATESAKNPLSWMDRIKRVFVKEPV